MTSVYVILAVLFLVGALIFWLARMAEDKGELEMKEKYMEAELELRKKMADVDASADVDDPLSML